MFFFSYRGINKHLDTETNSNLDIERSSRTKIISTTIKPIEQTPSSMALATIQEYGVGSVTAIASSGLSNINDVKRNASKSERLILEACDEGMYSNRL